VAAIAAAGFGAGHCSVARRSCSGSTSSSVEGSCGRGGAAADGPPARPPTPGSLSASASSGASTGRSGRGSRGRDLGSIMSGCDLRQA
jgi:hypothetical protein